MIFISNFNNSKKLDDILDHYNYDYGTNINFLLDDFAEGTGKWSVAKNASFGDIIVFMCAKEARHNLGVATSHLPKNVDDSFLSFVDEQKELYKKYSGYILGYGVISSEPEMDGEWLMSDIKPMYQFDNPIYIDEFRSFISVSKFGSITYLSDEQWERLKWVINTKNPGMFSDAIPPDEDILEKEFEEAVQEASKKSLEELKKLIKKKKYPVKTAVVNKKTYYRDPNVAAYVKKRANGYCQLCGKKAPFNDASGEPYLENHHIIWLSAGGEDSEKNCAALCPNCHRKMHIVNDLNDIEKLQKLLATLS